MEKERKLTPLEWAVYNTIKETTVNENRTISQKELVEKVNEQFGCAILKYTQKCTNCKNDSKGDHCYALIDLVRAINESEEVEKIIVVKAYSYKLGTIEECEEYYNIAMKRAYHFLKKASTISRKMKRDGQGKLISCQGKEITIDSKAREFVEAYIDGKEKNVQ